jgi:hypothetical protein
MPMENWGVPSLTGAALALVVFTYLSCRTIFQMEEFLQRWAKQRGFRIIHREVRTFFQGPFFTNRFRPVYYITIEDQQQRQKKGWVRLGWWYVVGFRETIEERWDE